MSAIQPQIKPLLVHRTVGILLAYLNCHTYILFVLVFTFVGRLAPGSDFLLSVAGGWLLLAIIIIIVYAITINGYVLK